MAYIGKSIESGTFSVLDTSGNTYNGSNVTFSLGTQVGSVAQLLVSHDGVLQKPGTDYTLATGGTQITFTTAPASGASIFIVEISGAVGGPLDSDLNGAELILDADGDTSITADTDDQIDIKIAGADDFQFTANTFTAQSGSTIAGQAVTATTVVGSGAAQFDTMGIGDAKDLGVGLHIKIADTSAGVSNDADEFVIEGSTNIGMTFATANDSVCSINFSDPEDNDVGQITYSHNDNEMKLLTNGTERMRILSDGSVKASTSSFEINEDTGVYHEFNQTTGNVTFRTRNSNASPYGNAIDFSAASPDNNSNYFLRCDDSTALKTIIYSDGDIQNADNSYGATSDVKLKEQITDASSQWDDIKDLKVRKFKFKQDVELKGDSDEHWRIGLVAQEAELVSPNLVKDNPDRNAKTNELEGTTTKSIKYSILYMKAVKALQEAQTRIETLEARVTTLEDA